MKFHPFAEVFPKLADAELRELADDIKAHGQREKIWTFKGQILDGRNRFNACVLAGVTAKFRPFKGTDAEALALVVSANMVRRHLTDSQRASAAAKVAGLSHGGDRRSDQAANLPVETQASAAEKFGVSERSVRAAKKVQEKGSKALNDAMDRGDISVSRAAAVVDLPKSEQLAAAKAPSAAAPVEPPPPDLVDYEPDDDEAYKTAIENVMMADDKLAAMRKQLSDAHREIHILRESRDHFQSQAGNAARIVKIRDKEIEKLKAQLDKLGGGAKAA